MSNKILIVDDLHPAFKAEKAAALGFEVDDRPLISRAETLAIVKDYIGIAVRTKFRIDKNFSILLPVKICGKGRCRIG
jgi:D-3-phosphoglycerate dehydrogenase